MPDDHDLRHDHHIHNHIDGLLHHHDDGSGVARTSTGVADPLANLEVEDESIIAAQNVVDATVGAVVGVGMEDEEALRAGEEAAAAAMEGECFYVCVFLMQSCGSSAWEALNFGWYLE